MITVSPAIARTLYRRYRPDPDPQAPEPRAGAAEQGLRVHLRWAACGDQRHAEPAGVHRADERRTVFKVEDPADLAAAVRRVLARRNWFRASATQSDLHHAVSWESQASRLSALYADLLGCDPGAAPSVADDDFEKKVRELLHL